MNLRPPSSTPSPGRTQATLRRRPSSLLVLVLAFASLALLPSVLRAGIVLEIDMSDETNVVFTATTINSQNDSENVTIQGIVLEDFFADTIANINTDTLSPAGDLYPSLNSGGAYDSVEQPGANASTDLRIFENFLPARDQDFDGPVPGPAARAFTGSMTANLSEANGFGELPGPSSGDVTVNGEIIGQWSVTAVPEPATAGLTGVLLLGWCLGQRSRRVRS